MARYVTLELGGRMPIKCKHCGETNLEALTSHTLLCLVCREETTVKATITIETHGYEQK